MKEATGELNATIIVVITVGLLSTFFFTVIWPRLHTNLEENTKCSAAYCPPVCDANKKNCGPNWADKKAKTVKCVYGEGNKKTEIICPYKG